MVFEVVHSIPNRKSTERVPLVMQTQSECIYGALTISCWHESAHARPCRKTTESVAQAFVCRVCRYTAGALVVSRVVFSSTQARDACGPGDDVFTGNRS